MSGIDWLADELQKLSNEGLLRHRREVRPLPSGKVLIGDREVWDFASNDYLGLATDPQVIAAAQEALQSHGVGARASQLVCGRTDLHLALEQAIAGFEGTQSAILFPTGMAANVGTVAALAGAEDAVFCDRLNHASLVDGCRLSGAKLRVYRHDELSGLRRALAREAARRKFIVTDTVFSMDGDLAPLPELCEIGREHDAVLIVDEAHGTGVFGSQGRGVADLQHVEELIDVRIGTLSKAIGGLGGFVAGSLVLTDFLWNKARSQIYSTALPPAICAASVAAIGIIQTEPSRRERLHTLAASFRSQLDVHQVTWLQASVGPIVPIILNEPEAAVVIAETLLQDGYLVGAIRPPTVPRGTSRLRVTIHSQTPAAAIDALAERLGQLLSRRVA